MFIPGSRAPRSSGGSISRPGSLRRSLILRILGVGLATILLSLTVLGLQIQRTAQQQAQDDASRHAKQSAAALSALFGSWRDELLIAATNSDYADWFAHPGRRPQLRPQIDAALVALHDVYPTLIDEACFISAGGPELSRQVSGQAAPTSELSTDESENPFFHPSMMMEQGQVWQASPYISPDTGRWVVSNSTPIQVRGHDVAMLHFEANLDAVRTLVAHGLTTGMQARIVDTSSGIVIADTSVHRPIVKGALAKLGTWRGAGPVRSKAAVPLGAANANHLTIEISGPSAQPFTTAMLLQALALLALVTALLAAVALRVGTSISRPVRHVTEVAEAMASGDLSSRTTVHRSDEIGRMASAINSAIDVMTGQQDGLRREYDARQEQLRNTQIQQHWVQEETRSRAQAVIDEKAAGVKLELQQLFDHVHEVQSGATAIDDRVASTGTATRALVAQASHADVLVSSLRESLRRVGGIADLITGVASQTNLLALNATIEAARAGHAGKGFGVVADEVKALATETARSTGEIQATIAVLEESAQAVASAIAAMAGDVTGIDDSTSAVTTVTAHQLEIVARMEGVVQNAVTRISVMSDITESLDRRVNQRIAVHDPGVLLVRGERLDVTLRDLSRTGVNCKIPPGCALGPEDHVTLEVILADQPMRIPVRVVRVDHDHGTRFAGMAFSEPGPQLVAAVVAHTAALLGTNAWSAPGAGPRVAVH